MMGPLSEQVAPMACRYGKTRRLRGRGADAGVPTVSPPGLRPHGDGFGQFVAQWNDFDLGAWEQTPSPANKMAAKEDRPARAESLGGVLPAFPRSVARSTLGQFSGPGR